MKHLKIISLLAIGSIIAIKPGNNYLTAAVPSEKKKVTVADFYDYKMLKIIEDSLKLIDPRNSITPELGVYAPGIFFGVEIYSNVKAGDKENVTIGGSWKKNRCISGAYNLAKVITPCAYDKDNVYVGVRYVEDNAVRPYLGTIVNISKPGGPFKAAFTMTPR